MNLNASNQIIELQGEDLLNVVGAGNVFVPSLVNGASTKIAFMRIEVNDNNPPVRE